MVCVPALPGLSCCDAHREEAIARYSHLVRYAARSLAPSLPGPVEYDDLVSYGTIGLIEAVDRFDASRGVKFETYALTRIRGAILDALRALDRMPRSLRRQARKIEQMIGDLALAKGRQPTEREVSGALGMDLRDYRSRLAECARTTVSLDTLLDEHAGLPGEGELTEVAEPSHVVEHEQMLVMVTGAVERLPERELLVVSLYYQEAMTMREIGAVMSISESRVCQLHSRALERLRGMLAREIAA